MEEIKKYIYLKNKDVRTRIEYVQGTNTIPIVLSAVDWDIPDGSEARIYIKKPSGKEVYNTAAISGNDITIQPTTQMFAEFGKQLGQVQIVNGDDIAATFLLEFDIEKNLAFESSAVESSDEYGVLDELIKQAQTAISDTQAATAQANAATSAANNAANTANGAANGANTAAAAANNAAEELQEKVNAGDFSASITVGTVTTGEPGSQASVTNSGTNKDAVLDFTIPRGNTGEIENLNEQPIANVIDKNHLNSMSVIPVAAFMWGNWNNSNQKYLKIKLPQISQGIFSFDIRIGMYSYGQAIYHVEGYISNTHQWNSQATCYSTGAMHNESDPHVYDMPVRFGWTDPPNTIPCIVIGDGVQSMYNMSVSVENFAVWGAQAEGVDVLNDYRTGWNIAVTENYSEVTTIIKTVEHPAMSYAYEISDETIAAFKAIGWTPPVGGAVIESLLDWISEHAEFATEKGSFGNWKWKKYADGTSKAVYKRTLTLNFDTQYGGIYFSKTTLNETYPQGVFKTVDTMEASTSSSGVGGVAFGNSDTSMFMKIWNGVAGADIEVTIMATVEGKWK